jgi:hypothetical protein
MGAVLLILGLTTARAAKHLHHAPPLSDRPILFIQGKTKKTEDDDRGAFCIVDIDARGSILSLQAQPKAKGSIKGKTLGLESFTLFSPSFLPF